MYIYLQNLLIFIFLYIPPLLFFINCSLKLKLNKLILSGITVLYLVMSMYTQNFLPFLLVLINIRYIRIADRGLLTDGYRNYSNTSEDYIRYNFDINNFKLLKGIKYAAATYGITIGLNIIIIVITSALRLNLSEQEIVKQLSKGTLNQLLYMVPIMIIFAPTVEEFTFRWLLFEKLFKPRIGVYMAAIVSSIMFSLVHFNLRSFPVIMIIGIINCYFIHKRGFWYAVFNHMVFNSVSVIIMIFQKIS
jgi:uncharacterized protein